MAVAMDLGDPASPFGSVHPRDKQDVGYRLALAGRAIAYKENSLYYTGPIASVAYVNTPQSIIVHYTHVVDNKLEIRSQSGFEVHCIKNGEPTWMESFLIKAVKDFVIIDNSCGADNSPTHVRYSWRDYPCVFKECAVYSGDLPSPPFILPVRQASMAEAHLFTFVVSIVSITCMHIYIYIYIYIYISVNYCLAAAGCIY